MKKSNYFVVIGGAISVIIIGLSLICWATELISPRLNGTIVSIYPLKSISHGKIIHEIGNVRADVDTNSDGIPDLIDIKFDISLIKSGKYIDAEKKSCVVIDRGRGYGGPSICQVK